MSEARYPIVDLEKGVYLCNLCHKEWNWDCICYKNSMKKENEFINLRHRIENSENIDTVLYDLIYLLEKNQLK